MNNIIRNKQSETMPANFLAHGSPLTLDDQDWMSEWRKWAKSIPKPDSILMISAHWEQNPITLSATETIPLYYDFYGFPREYYEVKYPAPGAPKLAERVKQLLASKYPIKQDEKRGLDHGAFVPLIGMYPEADIPVLQISLPTMDPEILLNLGELLAPLREENVSRNIIKFRRTFSTLKRRKRFDNWKRILNSQYEVT
jgi:4,5-DOPA dioxygenase extradiol